MKKLVLLVIISFMMAGTSMAMSWDWDLNGTGYQAFISPNFTTDVHFDNDLGAASAPDSESTVTQSFTGGFNDAILDNGDTFTEMGMLNVLDADNVGLSFLTDTFGGAYAYVEFTDLAGSIYNYNSGTDGVDTTLANYATAVQDDYWDIAFTPYAGHIDIYLDTDLDSSNGALRIAGLELLAGDGHSPEFILGEAEGQFGLMAGFDYVLDDVWSFAGGDFEDWLAAYGANSIMLTSFNLGATFQGVADNQTDLLFYVTNEGSFEMSAVPEPATIILLGGGLLGLGFYSRRRK